MFTNGPEDLGSIPGRVIPKTLKMVLDTSLLNTQQYKVRIEGKVEESKERSSALPYTSVLNRDPSGSPRLLLPTLLLLTSSSNDCAAMFLLFSLIVKTVLIGCFDFV